MNFQDQSGKLSLNSGITLIELLLVIAIVAILGGAATPFLSRFVLQINFDTSKDKLVGTLRKAQSYSLANRDAEDWGVCMTGNFVRLYTGSCSAPIISEDFSIPATVTVTGFEDITFNNRGEPSNQLTISTSTSIETATIILNQAGGIEVN
jgi:prepilin-type N-terminal cleavage/methylation domain-containing protein